MQSKEVLKRPHDDKIVSEEHRGQLKEFSVVHTGMI